MNSKYVLKKNKEIEATLRNKFSIGNRYFAIYFKENKLNIPKVAISVSKKCGNAVERNYQKRVLRVILNKYLDEFIGYNVLVVNKILATQLSFEEKEVQIKLLLENKKKNRRK